VELGVVKWAIEFIERLLGRTGERRRRFIQERVGPLEAYLNVAYAGLDLIRDGYCGNDDAGVGAEELAHSRDLFLEMATELAPMRHPTTAAAHAIGDEDLTESWRETEKMLKVLSTFLQLAQEVRGNRGIVRSVFDDAIEPITKARKRIRDLLT